MPAGLIQSIGRPAKRLVVERNQATQRSQGVSAMMSSNAINFMPEPEPGVRDARVDSADRERATLAFLAEYSAAVALRRRQRGTRADQRITHATIPVQPGWGDPKPND